MKRETKNAPRLDLIVVALISYCLYPNFDSLFDTRVCTRARA